MEPAAAPALPERPFPAVQYHWVADERGLKEATRSIVRAMVVNRARVALYAFMISMVLLATLVYPVLGGILLVFVVTIALLSYLMLAAYFRRGVKALYKPGTVWASGFGHTGFVMIGSISTVVVDYAAIASVRRVGTLVIVRLKGDLIYEVIPGALVPDGEFEVMQRWAAANRRPASTQT